MAECLTLGVTPLWGAASSLWHSFGPESDPVYTEWRSGAQRFGLCACSLGCLLFGWHWDLSGVEGSNQHLLRYSCR